MESQEMLKAGNMVMVTSSESTGTDANSPFRHPGWIEFVEYKWNLSSQKLVWTPSTSDVPRLEVLIYLDNAGRIRSVPHQLYHPVLFSHTQTEHSHRIEHQWLEASEGLAAMMEKLGLRGSISLDLPHKDPRSWQWSGFRTETRYTHIVALPFDVTRCSYAVRKAVRKSHELGYSSERTDDADAVMTCVLATEVRKGFTHNLVADDLRRLISSMGSDNCRLYLCRSQSGEVASGGVVLVSEQGIAIDWINGTVPEHYSGRAHQSLREFILKDLSEIGIGGLNLGGSNIKQIASTKSEWGGCLHEYFVVDSRSLWTLARDLKGWGQSQKRRLLSRASLLTNRRHSDRAGSSQQA
jgi:hypothetical protein